MRVGMAMLVICLSLAVSSTAAGQEVGTFLYSGVAGGGISESSSTAPLQKSWVLPSGQATSSGEVLSDYGRLTVLTSAVNPSAPTVLPDGGDMIGRAEWRDQFTITGATPGESVYFLVKVSVAGDLVIPDQRASAVSPIRVGGQTATVDHSLEIQGQPTRNASELMIRSYYLGNQVGCEHIVQGFVHGVDGCPADTDHGASILADEFVVSMTVGGTYSIREYLQTRSTLGSLSPANTSAHFTATFSLTPLGAGHGYTTASGRRYEAQSPNTAPTASAGPNQTVRPGATIQLDGSGSFDDNTPTTQLQYAWAFTSIPAGSEVVLSGSNTATPSFAPDLHGTYVVQLVVTDEGGLSSAASAVTISENPPPTADAGPDQLVIVGSVVALSGSGTDADQDALAFSWALTGRPMGSSAQLSSPLLPNTSFVPDQPGTYEAGLTVSDPFGPGEPDTVQINAITATGYAEIQLQSVNRLILGLPPNAVTNQGNRNAVTQFLSNAVVALQSGNLTAARHQVEQTASRTDGCALRGNPDGNGPGRDWITTCEAQQQVYTLLVDALAAMTPEP